MGKCLKCMNIIEVGDFTLYEKTVEEMNAALKSKFPMQY